MFKKSICLRDTLIKVKVVHRVGVRINPKSRGKKRLNKLKETETKKECARN